MTAAIAILFALSLTISAAVTYAVRPLALRFNFVDKPGHRKIHVKPKPLGGGVAILLAVALPMVAGLLYVRFAAPPAFLAPAAPRGQALLDAYWSGARQQTPLAISLLIGMAAMHLLGLRDDRRAMGPYSKLVIQLAIIATLVIGQNMRVLTFLDNVVGMGRWASVLLTVLWIAAITNAFNFLDNMDGLSAGVAAVCTTAFLVTTLSIQQWFIAACLAMLLGALLGFLIFNFAPASIFMGDSGSLLIGFLLGVLTVRTTYIPPEQQNDFHAEWYAVFAPVIVLALPLYDLVVVSALRLMRGKSPFVGDTNHFSHRLVARGMSRRTAVLCLYLVSASTAIAAILLPQVRSSEAAFLIFFQTILILGVVALLEQHPIPTLATKTDVMIPMPMPTQAALAAPVVARPLTVPMPLTIPTPPELSATSATIPPDTEPQRHAISQELQATPGDLAPASEVESPPAYEPARNA